MHNTTGKKKVIVGMSGGVDSSVAALLLLQQDFNVEGLFMKNWDEDDGSEYCTAITDLNDAQTVCDKIGIHLHTVNFATEYWDNVFQYFLSEYKAGRTPNPDILCNREIKFKAFLEYAIHLGADFIATGHYARIKKENNHFFLLKGLDANKDQSYFLHAVGEKEFSQTLFPIGELPKTYVRTIAAQHGLVTHDKKDSTGICFIGERRFKDFLQQYLPAKPGNIENDHGKVIGSHEGLMYYTIGQRQGIGIGGQKNADDDAWYVLEKDMTRNVLVIGQGNEHPWLFSNTLFAQHIHWINNEAPTLPYTCHTKVRYRQQDQPCVIYAHHNGYRVEFAELQRAVTPGQSVVFYQSDVCLGGGIIESTTRAI